MIKKIKEIYQNNISFKEKNSIVKLTKLSILILIILNIIVYNMINFGIEHFQYRYLKPSDPIFKYNYDCRFYIKDTKEDNFGSLNFYKSNAYSKYKYSSLDQQIYDNSIEREIELKINQLKGIEDFEFKFKHLLDYRCVELENKLKEIIYKNIAEEFKLKEKNLFENKKIEAIDKIEGLLKLNEEFKQNEFVKNIVQYALDNQEILKEYEILEKKYEIKYKFFTLLISTPLVVLFFMLMYKNNIKGNYSKYIINKNLLFVASIPFVIHLIDFIKVFIPNLLIEKILVYVFRLIDYIPLVFLLYFFTFILTIVATFLIIKLQNRKKNISKFKFIKFYNKNICKNCNNNVNYIEMNYCPICSIKLKDKCLECNSFKIIGTECCYKCGKKE